MIAFIKNYKKVAYFSTVLTGFAALAAQIVWQKYLAILVGSESRSLTLVVAVFLGGLAAGYYVFGLITEKKKWSRYLLLKLYGYVELITAIYIVFFCIYFKVLKVLSFNSPPYFIMDVIISMAAILLPTFLMGASIPILTATLPDDAQEINTVHAQVYGWNTLGACFGVLISGFYLISTFGLAGSLLIAGVINLLAAFVFIWNPLKGDVSKQDNPINISSVLPNRFYIIFTFLTGALIIAFEIFFVRILHISLGGARVYNFPIILTLFIGGLALGALSIDKYKVSVSYLIRQLFASIFLLSLLFWVTPYWPLWFGHIRSNMGFLVSDYVVFFIFVFGILLVCLLPVVFCLGQLLPIVYAILKKNKENYGRICGYLYFFNTLGTVLGAIGLGYLAFYFFDLNSLFKINISILIILTLVITFYEKYIRSLVVLLIFSFVFILPPLGWEYKQNYPQYIHNPPGTYSYLLKRWFAFKVFEDQKIKQTIFSEDGPNTTVKITGTYFQKDNPKVTFYLDPLFPLKLKTFQSYGITTNGKGDGETLGEFSTYTLISGLAYLFAPPGDRLSSAVIGLGTGMTAGFLGSLEDVKEVGVLEISPTVIKAVRQAPSDLNFGVFDNSKIHISETDAFKYFTKSRKKFDIIVSQPSNIWVVGVENLFSKEFYQLASHSLSEFGILGQWFQSYGVNTETIKMIMRTIRSVFPYTELYKIGHKDVFILAGLKPINHSVSDKRFFNPFLYKLFRSFGIHNKEDIYLAQVFNNQQYEKVISLPFKSSWFGGDKGLHSITNPKLSYRADKTAFLLRDLKSYDIASEIMGDEDIDGKEKIVAFQKYRDQSPEIWKDRCVYLKGFNFFCKDMENLVTQYQSFISSAIPPVRLRNYGFLRDRNLIHRDEEFLNNCFFNILKNRYIHQDTVLLYIQQRMRDKEYKVAEDHIKILKKEGIIDEEQYQESREYIHRTRINYSPVQQ